MLEGILAFVKVSRDRGGNRGIPAPSRTPLRCLSAPARPNFNENSTIREKTPNLPFFSKKTLDVGRRKWHSYILTGGKSLVGVAGLSKGDAERRLPCAWAWWGYEGMRADIRPMSELAKGRKSGEERGGEYHGKIKIAKDT